MLNVQAYRRSSVPMLASQCSSVQVFRRSDAQAHPTPRNSYIQCSTTRAFGRSDTQGASHTPQASVLGVGATYVRRSGVPILYSTLLLSSTYCSKALTRHSTPVPSIHSSSSSPSCSSPASPVYRIRCAVSTVYSQGERVPSLSLHLPSPSMQQNSNLGSTMNE